MAPSRPANPVHIEKEVRLIQTFFHEVDANRVRSIDLQRAMPVSKVGGS